MANERDSSPHGVPPGENPHEEASRQEVLVRLGELQRDSGRLRSFAFWGISLVLAVFVGLMVYFVLYLESSRKNMESSLAEGLPGFGRELGVILRKELEQGMELQEEIASLERTNKELRGDLATSEREIHILRKKERDYQRLLDTRREELEQAQAMVEELVGLSGGAAQSPAVAENGSSDEDLNPKAVDAEDRTEPAGAAHEEEQPSDPASDLASLLRELNRIFDSSDLGGIKIAECDAVSDLGLVKPKVSVSGFQGAQTAILLPELVEIVAEGNGLRLQNRGAGSFTPLGGTSQTLPEGAWSIRIALPGPDEIRHPRLRAYLGLEPLATAPESTAENDVGAETGLLERINSVLSQERGRQFRFTAIGSVSESGLHDVALERFEAGSRRASAVEAQSCEVVLCESDRYVELQFESGHIIRKNKRIPFYDNRYRLTLTNIDPELWRSAALDFLQWK